MENLIEIGKVLIDESCAFSWNFEFRLDQIR